MTKCQAGFSYCVSEVHKKVSAEFVSNGIVVRERNKKCRSQIPPHKTIVIMTGNIGAGFQDISNISPIVLRVS